MGTTKRNSKIDNRMVSQSKKSKGNQTKKEKLFVYMSICMCAHWEAQLRASNRSILHRLECWILRKFHIYSIRSLPHIYTIQIYAFHKSLSVCVTCQRTLHAERTHTCTYMHAHIHIRRDNKQCWWYVCHSNEIRARSVQCFSTSMCYERKKKRMYVKGRLCAIETENEIESTQHTLRLMENTQGWRGCCFVYNILNC